MDMKRVGKKIKEKRKEHHWTQAEFAKMLNISVVFVGQIEKGQRKPSLKTLVNILNLFEITANDLLFDELIINKNRFNASLEKYNLLSPEDQEKINKLVDIFYEYDKKINPK